MMTRRTLGFAGALVLSALVGGTIMSAVMAAEPSAGATAGTIAPAAPAAANAANAPAAPAAPAAASEACTTFRTAFAAELDVTQAELTAAAKAAVGATVDAAVSKGTLTADEAARIKERVAKADGDACRFLDGWRGGIARAAVQVGKDALDAAADSLGMAPAEVRRALRGGSSLRAIATDRGVSYETVSAAVLSAVKADVDAAVAAGSLAKARADRILARVEARLDAGWPPRSR